MRKLLILFTAIFLASCSAQWHVQRAVLKDPSILTKGLEVKFDTVVITQERTLNDTVVLNDVDSVIIEKDRVVTKLWRVHDTLRVETICPPDTVRIETFVECPPQVKYIPLTWWQKNRWWIFLIVVGTASFFVARKIKI